MKENPMDADGQATELFDRALSLRDAGDYGEARRVLEQLVLGVDPEQRRLRAHAHLQLGNIAKRQGLPQEHEAQCRVAVSVAPGLELASLALFFALVEAGHRHEALAEAVRYLSRRESSGYRELFAGGYGHDLPPEEHALAHEARRLLVSHRDVQRSRAVPMTGDTVRIRAEAASEARPGSLARLRATMEDGTVEVQFTDGERRRVELSVIDHHDI